MLKRRFLGKLIRRRGSFLPRSKEFSIATTPAASPQRSVMFVSFIWPERSSSAAGVRTTSLIKAFQAWGWAVHFLASAAPNAYSAELQEDLGVVVHRCIPNRGADFDQALAAAAPDVVVFDRFTAEEAWSFRVRKMRPSAARVLDMQDMHSLRRARQAVIEAGGSVADAMHTVPNATSSANDLARELASVHRSDLTLVCSSAELELLKVRYGLPSHKLVLAPFFCGPISETEAAALPSFAARSGFVTIGNFMHRPNLDSVRWLCQEVWPLVRARLPSATLSVYGAYADRAPGTGGQGAKLFNRPGEGLFVHGFADSVGSVLAPARVMLAPLRFGAGIKGKIVDAWQHGLPVVTTPIGAEGMRSLPLYDRKDTRDHGLAGGEEASSGESESWGGSWQSLSADEVAFSAIRLHDDEVAWGKSQVAGVRLLGDLFPRDVGLRSIRVSIERCLENLTVLRESDFVGAMLWHHSARSTEYFSRWIELKESLKP